MKNKSDPGGEVEVWIQSMLTGKRYEEFRYLGDEQESRKTKKCYIEADVHAGDVFEICIRTPASFGIGTWSSLRYTVHVPVFEAQETWIAAENFEEAGKDIVKILNFSYMTPFLDLPSHRRLSFESFFRNGASTDREGTISIVCERVARVDFEEDSREFAKNLKPPPSKHIMFERGHADMNYLMVDFACQFEFHYRPKGMIPGLPVEKPPTPKQGLPFSEGWASTPYDAQWEPGHDFKVALSRMYPDDVPEREETFDDDLESLTDDGGHGTELKQSAPPDVDEGGDPVSGHKSSTMQENGPQAQLSRDFRVENLDEEGVKIRLQAIEHEQSELQMHLKKLQEDKKWQDAC